MPTRPVSAVTSLQAASLHLWRGDRHVLRGVSFAVRAGEALHVAGPNGVGKTTLLRVVCGLLQAEEGEVLWNGTRASGGNPEFLEALAYLAHDTALKGDLTSSENLFFSVGLRRSIDGAEIAAILDELGIPDCAHLPCRVLSAGQRRRVALCRVLLSRAPLWILDEPFTNLDDASTAQITAALARHLEHGGLALIAAHQGLNLDSNFVRRLELS
jgi:heme exporter protein A